MISKNQFCRHIVGEYCQHERINEKELSDAHCYRSGSLAVAMEHLGLIRDQETKDYVSSRNGLYITSFDNNPANILTMREMIDLLPNNVE